MSKEILLEDAQAENIYCALYDSRNHPGVSLENIAAICGKVFDKAELEAFIKELNQVIRQKKDAEKSQAEQEIVDDLRQREIKN